MPNPLLHWLATLSIASALHAAPCRNATSWPFAADSIWNVAIGSAARYEAANIFEGHTPKSVFSDDDYFIVTALTDPLTPWYDQGHWNATPNCLQFPWSPLVTSLNWPANLTISAYNNNAAAILLPDGDSLVLTQPVYKCNATAPILSLHDKYHGTGSLRGPGTWGGHGGSSLNAIGGSLRVGEVLPGGLPPQHTLKLQLFAHMYYYGAKGGANKSTCYAWPALNCDGYFADCAPNSSYNCYGGTNVLLRPGALLAIEPSALPGLLDALTTPPAMQLAWTLVNYGGLLCDDTYDDRVGGTDSFLTAAEGMGFICCRSFFATAREFVCD